MWPSSEAEVFTAAEEFYAGGGDEVFAGFEFAGGEVLV